MHVAYYTSVRGILQIRGRGICSRSLTWQVSLPSPTFESRPRQGIVPHKALRHTLPCPPISKRIFPATNGCRKTPTCASNHGEKYIPTCDVTCLSGNLLTAGRLSMVTNNKGGYQSFDFLVVPYYSFMLKETSSFLIQSMIFFCTIC